MTRVAVIIAVLAVATPAIAESERWDPTTIANAEIQVGAEGPVGLVLLVDAGVGYRIRGLMWHLRGDLALVSGSPGGGSSSFTYRMWDARVGPTWWSCGGQSCAGLDLSGGLEYLRIHEHGGDGGPCVPSDAVRREYDPIVDARIRFLRFGREYHGGVELSVGLRLKARLFHTGDRIAEEDSPIGAGFLFGLGFGAAF